MSNQSASSENDFVDRDKELGDLVGIARGVDKRIVLVVGRLEIGKTSLLKEFWDANREQDFACFYYDLATRPVDLDKKEKPYYLAIADEVLLQLEPQGMQINELESDIAGARKLRAPKTHMEKLSDAREMLDRHLGKSKAGVRETGGARREGGIDFRGDTTISHAQLAARDQYIFEATRDESEEVQAAAQRLVTDSLKKSLTAFTRQRCVVFLFDHWKQSNEDTRLWLINSAFFKWVLYRNFSKAVLVIASEEVESWYEATRDYFKVAVDDLPPEAVITYWKKRLPVEALPGDPSWFGFPPLLKTLAEQTARRLARESGSG